MTHNVFAIHSAFSNATKNSAARIIELLEKTTTYTITDAKKEKSSISIPKFDADILQKNIPDVHAFIQKAYDSAVEKYPYLSRRKKGDEVRQLVWKKAEGYIDIPAYQPSAIK